MKVKKVLISLTLIFVFVALSVFSHVGTIKVEAAKKKYGLDFSQDELKRDPLNVKGKLLVMRVGDEKSIGLRNISVKYEPRIAYNDKTDKQYDKYCESFISGTNIKWSIGNKKIIDFIGTLSGDLVYFKAKRKGKTTISATYKGKTYKCKIYVKFDMPEESDRIKYTPEREKKVQKRIMSLMEQYPEGSDWGEEDWYSGRCTNRCGNGETLAGCNAAACEGFAMLTAEYGQNYEVEMKLHYIKNHDLSNVRVGDVIYYIYQYCYPDGTPWKKSSHYATVIGKGYDDYYGEVWYTTDGNYRLNSGDYGTVTWGSWFYPSEDGIVSEDNSLTMTFCVWSFWDTWDEYDGWSSYEKAQKAFEKEYKCSIWY